MNSSNLKKYCQDFFFKNFIDDNDFLLLSNEVSSFIETGEKEDAFTVFYAFSEKFKLFGSGYENIKILLDLLKEYEHLSGQLTQKQRDHYSHSVFVFTLGLAIYQMDNEFKCSYNSFYNLNVQDGYKDFLYNWGLVALFHDIGYPFQLTFDQLKEYCVNFFSGNKNIPYVMYGNMPVLTEIPIDLRLSAQTLINKEVVSFDEMFAGWISKRLGYNEEQLIDNLKRRIVNPSYSIDHGYFSSLLLVNKMMEACGFAFTDSVLDVLTAILLHNSLNRYDIKEAEPISLNSHPLAYLLVLCDELQSWNRKGFGKDSKLDILPQNIDIEIQGNQYFMTYKFESEFESMKDSIKMIQELKEVDGKTKFDTVIMGLIKDGATLKSSFVFEAKPVQSALISDSRFFNLLEIAKSIHFSYMDDCMGYTEDSINTEFANLSLDFKLSNIHQAKSYAGKLSKIGCFYSDESFNYKVVDSFNEIQYFGKNCADFLARDEHVRWVRDRIASGWHYGTSYLQIEDKQERLSVRNALKEHKDIVPYDSLTTEAQQKDINVINNMIPLLRKNGDIKIYKTTTNLKPFLYLAFNNIEIIHNPHTTKQMLTKYLSKMLLDYELLIGCVPNELGIIVMECCSELKIPYEIVVINKDESKDVTNALNLFAMAHYFTDLKNGGLIDVDNYFISKKAKFVSSKDLKE